MRASTRASSGRPTVRALLVECGRGDLQQRHDLAGVGLGVSGQREAGQFEHLFVPNAHWLDDPRCFHKTVASFVA
jgi:hypothetical protein